MADTMDDIMHPGHRAPVDPKFPYAPEGWAQTSAMKIADEEGIVLSDDHWDVVRALQEYYVKNDKANIRELHDALEEKFNHKGGMRYLYKLFPGGPIAQGSRVAGVEPPAGSVDKGFGSVV